ncbi:MAG: thioesterase family protein [Pseudomonadota bacterium]
MRLAYRGSVNRWECDENDHLNVRFFVDRHWQSLAGGAREPQVQARINSLHLRFIAEARLAQAMSGYFGVLHHDEHTDVTLVQTILRDSYDDRILSTCLHEVYGRLEGPDAEQLPEVGSRGIPAEDLPYVQLDRDRAADYGFAQIGAGTVLAHECDPQGQMYSAAYMGRISDAMPHLWHHMHPGSAPREQEGGAVLEYRLRFHRPLTHTDAYEIWSGVFTVGPKVQQFAHLVFDVDSGGLVASAQAAGVRMDLNARKSITLDDARLAALEAVRLRRPEAT